MRNEWSVLALLCAAAVVMPAHAGSTADELAQIESENVVLKARLRLLETRAQMAARQADIERYAPGSGSAMPTVAGIDGMGGKLYATVLLENGYVVEARAGDTLPNGMRVASVRGDGVVVTGADRKRIRLKPSIEPEVRAPSISLTSSDGPALSDRLPVMPPLPARPGAPK